MTGPGARGATVLRLRVAGETVGFHRHGSFCFHLLRGESLPQHRAVNRSARPHENLIFIYFGERPACLLIEACVILTPRGASSVRGALFHQGVFLADGDIELMLLARR